jgi:hypothetical protein
MRSSYNTLAAVDDFLASKQTNYRESEEDLHNGGGGGDEDETIAPQLQREKWNHEELTSRKRLREELGEPEARKYCFGCVYDLSQEAVPLCNESFRELCMVASKCIGQMSMEALGRELERLYNDFREETNRKARYDGQSPLPEWKAASIVEHLKEHNVDPEIQTWVRLVEIQELINKCHETILEVNEHTGKSRVSKDGARTYKDLVQLWYFVAKQPLDKQFGYRKGGRMDVESVNQPFITKNQKSIVDYYVSAQRRHFV